MHLQTLVAKGHLSIVRQVLTMPNVYRITDRGLRRTSDDKMTGKRTPIGNHLVHELLITELAVSISEATRARPDLSIPWQRRFELGGHPAFAALVPDYAFLFRHDRGSLICFAEVFSGEESAVRIGQKLDHYANWAAQRSSQQFLIDLYRLQGALAPRAHFRLLVVVHNRRSGADHTRLAQIFTQAFARLSPEMNRRIWGTTVQALGQSNGSDPCAWIRAIDLLPTLEQTKQAPKRRRHSLLSAALQQTVPYPLFPKPSGTDDVTPSADYSRPSSAPSRRIP
jgi:hypothetical protein